MLRAVYKHARSDDRILDVSVEDPSPDFQVGLGREHKLYTKNCAKRAREEGRQREGAVERVAEGGRETKKDTNHIFDKGTVSCFLTDVALKPGTPRRRRLDDDSGRGGLEKADERRDGCLGDCPQV
jgi:hypothetical protein